MTYVSYYERGTYNLTRYFYLNKQYNIYKEINKEIFNKINKSNTINKSNKINKKSLNIIK